MVREDLITGAISFLQDPSVASAPIDQRVAFLRSKNLTQEEIDTSLARVGQSAPSARTQYAQPPTQQNYAYPPQQQPPPYWNQSPPDPPRRDWRDYFIAATVMGGLGYGLYWTAKRYITPLIAPPTPPQLEQDKASVDASFDKAFAMLEQLATDTQALKTAEEERTKRLDTALGEVESVVARLKEANEAREVEGRRMARELGEIREAIPKAVEKEREGTDGRLRELGGEMKSLKTLVANRMAGGAPRAGTPTTPGNTTPVPTVNGAGSAAGSAEVNGAAEEGEKAAVPERAAAASPLGRTLGGAKSPAIPAWQLAAKKRSEEAKKDAAGGAQEGGSGEAQAGA